MSQCGCRLPGKLRCEAPTGHWVAALPHTKLRGGPACQAFQSSVLSPLGLMQPQLVAPDQCGGWKLGRFAHPNALHCFLPCGDWLTQPFLSQSQVRPPEKSKDL